MVPEEEMPKQPTLTSRQQHPLLIEDVMTEVFSYFRNDAANLRRFRLVCSAWNSAAAPVFKRSLRWRIWPENSGGKGAKEFEEVMRKSSQDLIRSFQLMGRGRDDKCWEDPAAPTFFSLFADRVVELRLDDSHLHELAQKTLPNLELLDLCLESKGMTSTSWKQLLNSCLPKLKSLVLRLSQENMEPLLKDVPPNLCSLTVYGWRRMLGGFEGANIDSLTSLKLYWENSDDSEWAPAPAVHYMNDRDADNIIGQCKKLERLAIPWNPDRDESIERLLHALAPRLEEVELVRSRSSSLPHQRLCFPRLRVFRLRNVQEGLGLFGQIEAPLLTTLDLPPLMFDADGNFPESLSELRIDLNYDEPDKDLRLIFTRMRTLKSLHLGSSRVTDSGVTGIPKEGLALLPAASSTDSGIDAAALRRFPFIGDLKLLQHFTFDGHTLSNKSVWYGFNHLTELTYFKVPPFHDSGPGYLSIERVDAPALVDACHALVRIDVNGFPEADGDNDFEDEVECGSNRLDFIQPSGATYRGCGLRDDEIERVRSRNPWLEIVHREKYSISEQERAASRGIVLRQ